MGKGLTFDSGGYNLKVGGMIEMMKFDMGGAGAVLGAAQALAGIKPEGVEVSSGCSDIVHDDQPPCITCQHSRHCSGLAWCRSTCLECHAHTFFPAQKAYGRRCTSSQHPVRT